LRDIARNHDASAASGLDILLHLFGSRINVQIIDDDISAFPGKRFCDTASNALARSGNDRNLLLKFHNE
jgi:hypothetical protein